MSTLIVESVEADIVDHNNADSLCIAKIRGKAWQCIVNKFDWEVKPGDVIKGVYFPIDSILPEEIINSHGLEKLTHKGRIKSVRLRGELSQGLLLPVGKDIPDMPVGVNLTEELRVIKYEMPIPVNLSGEAELHPEGWKRYTEIENIKNFPNIFQEGEQVVVTEKLHGANLSVYKKDGRLYVAGRNYCWKESDKNAYWRAIEPIREKLEKQMKEGSQFYGELLGVQDLRYGYENGEVNVRFFDIREEEQFCSVENLNFSLEAAGLEQAPFIYQGFYSYEKMEELSKGKSLMADHIREGIVIRPLKHRSDSKIGRVILKFISDDYLTRKGKKTEHH